MKKKFGIAIDNTLIKVWEDEIFSIFNENYDNLGLFDGVKEKLNELKDYFYNRHLKIIFVKDKISKKLD